MVRYIGNPPRPGTIVPMRLLGELGRLPISDTGNAEAFGILYRHQFRYDHSRKRWLVWNGLCWVPDADGAASRAAIDSARWRRTVIWLSWAEAHEKEAKSKLIEDSESARQGESVHGINATLEIAKCLRGFATVAAEYDRDPFLLTVGNGTLDLRTGQLRSAWPDDLITRGTRIWRLYIEHAFEMISNGQQECNQTGTSCPVSTHFCLGRKPAINNSCGPSQDIDRKH
jgi:hypothetical protein